MARRGSFIGSRGTAAAGRVKEGSAQRGRSMAYTRERGDGDVRPSRERDGGAPTPPQSFQHLHPTHMV